MDVCVPRCLRVCGWRRVPGLACVVRAANLSFFACFAKFAHIAESAYSADAVYFLLILHFLHQAGSS